MSQRKVGGVLLPAVTWDEIHTSQRTRSPLVMDHEQAENKAKPSFAQHPPVRPKTVAGMEHSIELQGVANFRDVGKTVNRRLDQKRVREGVLFRSARPDDASAKDQALMRDKLGITTIMDLRSQTEIIEKAKGFRAQSFNGLWSWFLPKPTIPRIHGISYKEIRITGRSFERHLLRQLSFWSLIKVMVFFVFGYRLSAIRLIATQVMVPRGPVGLGLDTIDHSAAEISQALKVCASTQSLPVLVHCTHGKDRTGLIIVLILMILDVPWTAILYDYKLTDNAVAAELGERVAELENIGLNEDWAWTSLEMVFNVKTHLDEKYGGLENYLDKAGFGHNQRMRLRQLLLY